MDQFRRKRSVFAVSPCFPEPSVQCAVDWLLSSRCAPRLSCLYSSVIADRPPNDVTMNSFKATRSMLHHDSDNIINCLIAGGEKHWLLLDTSFKHVGLGFKWAEEGWIASDSSPVDPDYVDLRQYPAFQHLPWRRATQKPGDCIYLPAQYLHQVRTAAERSVALSVMFLKEEMFPHDNDGCENVAAGSNPGYQDTGGATWNGMGTPAVPPTTMAALNFTWTYNGSGPVLMGYISPHALRRDLIASVVEHAADGATALSYERSRTILEAIKPDMPVKNLLEALHATPPNDQDAQGQGLSLQVINDLTVDELKALAFMIDVPHDAYTESKDLLGFNEDSWPPARHDLDVLPPPPP